MDERKFRAVCIGVGTIGGAVIRKVAADPMYKACASITGSSIRIGKDGPVETTDGVSGKIQYIRREFGTPDIAFLAIPTRDKGEIACEYIRELLDKNIAVVTCEKGALAYRFPELRPRLKHIGYKATCGGGTMMIPALQGRHLRRKKVVVHAVVNGTLNYIFAGVGLEGRSLAEMVREASKLGYAEPGASDPLAVIRGEVEDVTKKLPVLFNTVFAGTEGPYLTPDDFTFESVDEKSALALTSPGNHYRYIVRVTNQDIGFEADPSLPGSLHIMKGGWRIDAGFVNLRSGSKLDRWIPGGVNNGVLLEEGPYGADGIYELCKGPGAGPEPTAEAMMCDARELLAHRLQPSG